MDWTPGGMSSDVEDRRGDSGGGGGGFGFGGGGLGLGGAAILLVLSLLTGRNYLGQFFSGSSSSQPGVSRSAESGGGEPVQESAAEHRSAQLVSYVLDDAQKTWTTILPEQTNRNYRHAKLVLFRDRTNSGCGNATAATGPFYCPEDERVYIDLGFWEELGRLGGSTAEFAQAYVITHELGHHVQNILGTESKVQQGMQADRSQRSRLSVALELQADCYAGVWAHSTQERNIIHPDDVNAALKAAAAVGDDHIQRMQRGTVSPETFTHGSSEQRETWFKRGLESGQVNQCDTFRAGAE